MKLNLSLLLVILLLSSCQQKTKCNNLRDIFVNPSLNIEIEDYCDLLSKALVNEEVILQLLKIDINTNNAFYHGEVLVQLIDYKGEELFIKKIKDFNEYDRFRLLTFLNSGFFEINRKNITQRSLKEDFPILSKALLTNTTP